MPGPDVPVDSPTGAVCADVAGWRVSAGGGGGSAGGGASRTAVLLITRNRADPSAAGATDQTPPSDEFTRKPCMLSGRPRTRVAGR